MIQADTPLIIEVSLNGSVKPEQNPNVPYEDDDIVAQAVECMEAGAALVHNHTRDPVFGKTGAMDAEDYARPWRKLLALRPDAILTPTMPADPGGPQSDNVPVEVRFAHIEAMAQEGLIAQGLCDPGSFSVSVPTEDGVFAPTQLVYRNDAHDSHYYVEACRRLKLGMSISIFEPGFVKFIMALHRAGKLPPGGIMKFYFGADSMSFGLPPTAKALDAYLEMIEGSDLPWSVSAFGDDCVGCGLAEEAIKRGGHVQVGIEPYGGPRTPTNVELVEEVVALAGRLGRPIATPEQAAAMLNLPTYPVPFAA
ncbi:BKACE family enzyme [Parasphingorhabdus cellanae]|uniref:3-keto-5-aminohexanoate cleavage protein n=1 Tax=Parasphingorhabdus cellanae TaxID=2806553 RepID=A0ABX7T579_9SPHN|nr:3-keto-5-aminohexanoate cleavage protein [Parasphingorhabdus cellanae]QTD56739.1 3-keto-5-aminohexanoate cleavage protein [Parasphingorhabdus cellanae]